MKPSVSRRTLIKHFGLAGLGCTAGVLSSFKHSWSANISRSELHKVIRQQVEQTYFVDTHEHLMEEHERLSGVHSRIKANDWSVLLAHYINSDLITAGMSPVELEKVFSPDIDPIHKWNIVAPYWDYVKSTGYGRAVELTVHTLYGVSGLSESTVPIIQRKYDETVKKGFYQTVLQDYCRIESCQVNYLGRPFSESPYSTLLMQDISILGMHVGPDINGYAEPAGVTVKDLNDWHRVIDWWFDTYGKYAVAVKSQAAYSRGLDYGDATAEDAAPVFLKRLNNEPLTAEERKTMEDHLFWYCVRKAAEHALPVKIHTGYYAGHNNMPLGRVAQNPHQVTDLCRKARDVTWVFMHIGYPYYEEMIAAAKHYTNCHIDMCWGWILSPVASQNFLKQYLVTAPVNKVYSFGADYIFVEMVIGHAQLGRIGITNTLCDLVEEDWITLDTALELVEMVMRQNARTTFTLAEKTKTLESAPWREM